MASSLMLQKLVCCCCCLTAFLVLLNPIDAQLLGCFNSIISFGDSLTDTGNELYLTRERNPSPYFSHLPYGETYFHHPTGRFSDGRLMIDFIVESLGLPLVPAYKAEKDKVKFKQGVNFAVGGSTALDPAYLSDKGVKTTTNTSLVAQLGWFKEMLSSHYKFPSERKEFVRKSLVLVGEVGGNDFIYGFFGDHTVEEVESYVPEVINTISSAIQVVIESGASTVVVPGSMPLGCSTALLTKFIDSDKEDYDPLGCINWLNQFSQNYNELLQKELNVLRQLHSSVTITYADHYNAAMQIYQSPSTHGFTKGALVACCGAGGPYNYKLFELCGDPTARNICSDPRLYASWDGMHFTEAAYKLIATSLLEGNFTFPPLPKICTTTSSPNVNHFDS